MTVQKQNTIYFNEIHYFKGILDCYRHSILLLSIHLWKDCSTIEYKHVIMASLAL